MNFENKVIFITGANRGIGKALVESALRRGAKKIYASSRQLKNLPNFNDSRVVAVELDILRPEEIQRASMLAEDTQILINNAGVLNGGTLIDSSLDLLRQDMEVNYFGTIQMMKAFIPILRKNSDPRIINIVSIAKFVNFPFIAGYCASKAALYSITQAARIELSKEQIPVHAVNPGAIDTDMNKGSTMEMTSAEEVAESILQEVEKEILDIVPDKIGKGFFEVWQKSPQELESLSQRMFFGN